MVANGEVYIQNAASWLPVLALDPKPGDVILDVCAAPGGKASHIQAITLNQSKLTCNDNSKPRLLKLQRNMERLGADATYTLCDATRLSRTFQPATFDRILLDAPCSGEGLMTLDDLKLFDSWSVAHIRRLSDLQKKILSESWQLLKPGGTLVYSTCTMAPEENEAVIDYFLRKNPDAQLEPLNFPLENRMPALISWNDKPYTNDLSPCLRLVPGKLTEAFFVAKLKKACYTETNG
jgi:16S rRNA (cytosine1407-C5)-methyltransferase